MNTNTARALAPASARPRLHPSAWQGFTGFASSTLDQAQYENECLAGHCFPRPGDTDMLHRCREEYRIKQWLELFRRFHANSYATPSNENSLFRRYFVPLLPVRPHDLTRPVVVQWFHEIGQHSRVQANKSLGLLRTLYNKADAWQLWDGVNPATKIRWYKKDSRERFCPAGRDAETLGVAVLGIVTHASPVLDVSVDGLSRGRGARAEVGGREFAPSGLDHADE